MGFRPGCGGVIAVLAGGFWPAGREAVDVGGAVLEVWALGRILSEGMALELALTLGRCCIAGWVLVTTGRATAGCFPGFPAPLPRDSWAMAGAKEGRGAWDLTKG